MSRAFPAALLALLASPCGDRNVGARRTIWVADRGAGTLHRLGPDLSLRATSRCGGFPRVVVALEGGGAWAACGTGPEPGDPYRLVRVEADGRVAVESGPFGWVSDLASASGGGAWIADRGRGLLVRIDRGGDARSVRPVPGILCVERGSGSTLFGDDRGNVVSLSEGGWISGSWLVPGQATDLKEGRDSAVWVLDATGPGRLLRLGPAGEVFPMATLGFSSEHFGLSPSGIWIAATDAPFLRRCAYDGSTVADVWIPAAGDANFVEAWGEGALAPVGGALAEVGPDGAVRRVAGGFRALAGVSVSR